MKPVVCPNCQKPTLILWIAGDRAGQPTCCHCASERPSETRICFCPRIAPDGLWHDGDELLFESLHEFLGGCFSPESTQIDRGLLTKNISALELLVERFSRFSTPYLAPGIELVGQKGQYDIQNARNEIVWEAQHQLYQLKNGFQGVAFARVSWTLLSPSGDGAVDPVGELQTRLVRCQQRMEWSRIAFLSEAKPDLAFIGEESFDGYCAFLFLSESVAFLESPIVGNALYVMPSSQWEQLSKLSKTQLLLFHDRDVRRIPHLDIAWTRRLSGLYPRIFLTH